MPPLDSHTLAKLDAPASATDNALPTSPAPTTSATPSLHPAAAPPRPKSYATWCRILTGERYPAAVVDLDAFDANVALVARVLRERGHNHRLRLATKSIRVPELIRRVLAFGPPYQGLMCYAVEEAEFLASQGFDDLLIAYPTVQPCDLTGLRRLHESGTTVRLMVDGIEQLALISHAMRGCSRPFPLVLDIDMSWRPAGGRVHLGVRRSPIRSTVQALQLFEEARHLPGIQLTGLMGYEAQVAGLGDRNPFKRTLNPIARIVRRQSIRAGARLREQLAGELQAAGHSLEVFNGGGTGSVNWTVDEPWLTEVTVGSGFLCSHLFDYYSNIRYQPAAFFALQVTRSSDPGLVTCQGGGYVASGEPGWDKVPRPWLPEGLELLSSEACGEVQTPLRVPVGTHLRPGAPVLFRHAKAGELAEHFADYLLVSAEQVVQRAPTYRGLGQCFL